VKIKISGAEYDIAELGKLSLFDLLELKKQTGLDVDGLQEVFKDAEDGDGSSVLASEEGLTAFGAMIWLSRRKAGERLTFEEACDFPLEELEFVDDDPEPDTENPT
jgi:hypothetical protein